MTRFLSALKRCLCITTGLITLSVAPTVMAQEYRITQIPNLPNVFSITTAGINKSGQVTGSSDLASALICGCNEFDAILYSKGVTADLGSLEGRGGGYAFGNSVNDLGQVTGTDLGERIPLAFLYSDNALTQIGGYDFYGNGINNAGQITGSSGDAYLYSNGVITDLGVLPGGSMSSGQGINNGGEIAGYGDTPTGNHAFIYENGKLKDIGVLPGGMNSEGAAINDCGQVTGFSDVAKGSHAFLYSHGRMKDLGALPGATQSSGNALNNHGDVVGQSNGHAFVYTNGKMRDLNKLVLPNSGWILQSATGINDKGEIAVTATDISGQGVNFALLLTPLDNRRDKGESNGGSRDGRDHQSDDRGCSER